MMQEGSGSPSQPTTQTPTALDVRQLMRLPAVCCRGGGWFLLFAEHPHAAAAVCESSQ
jgi:hypothetical protein